MTLLIVNEIREFPADRMEDRDIEVVPTAHLNDEGALEQIATINHRGNSWSISEVEPGRWTRRLAVQRDRETGKDVIVR